MSVEDSESRRFEINIWLSFSQADLSPTSADGCFFSGFLESLELFFARSVLIPSGSEILWRVSLKFKLFLATSRFRCHRSEHKSFKERVPKKNLKNVKNISWPDVGPRSA